MLPKSQGISHELMSRVTRYISQRIYIRKKGEERKRREEEKRGEGFI